MKNIPLFGCLLLSNTDSEPLPKEILEKLMHCLCSVDWLDVVGILNFVTMPVRCDRSIWKITNIRTNEHVTNCLYQKMICKHRLTGIHMQGQTILAVERGVFVFIIIPLGTKVWKRLAHKNKCNWLDIIREILIFSLSK